MYDASGAMAADQQFFASLLKGDLESLDRLLAEDFIMVDVMAGNENSKTAFLGVVKSGQLKFDAIDVGECRARLYGTTAVIIGSTKMRGKYGDAAFAAHSRYTHVFVRQQNQWRFASAQGTQINGM